MTLGGAVVRAPAAVVLIRLMVGGVFLSEGLQKFLFPNTLGFGRFATIGIPAPEVMAPFVGIVEVGCGLLLIIGLLVRFAAVPLFIDICVAIATTKVPIFFKHGFWAAVHEGRTDYCMLLGTLFLCIVGGGPWALEARSRRRRRVEAAAGRREW